jgi:hypothetical protein
MVGRHFFRVSASVVMFSIGLAAQMTPPQQEFANKRMRELEQSLPSWRSELIRIDAGNPSCPPHGAPSDEDACYIVQQRDIAIETLDGLTYDLKKLRAKHTLLLEMLAMLQSSRLEAQLFAVGDALNRQYGNTRTGGAGTPPELQQALREISKMTSLVAPVSDELEGALAIKLREIDRGAGNGQCPAAFANSSSAQRRPQ